MGAPVGGALAEADWRWVFWINLPICGVAVAGLLVFIRGSSEAEATRGMGVVQKVGRLDLVGFVVFPGSMVAILVGLIDGGTRYPWSSWRVILPIVVGGWGGLGIMFSSVLRSKFGWIVE